MKCVTLFCRALSIILLVPVIGIEQGGIGTLIAGMMGLGFGLGMLDVSMNGQASLIEKSTGIHSMGLFHANYAIGGFLGSILGGILGDQDIDPLSNFVLVSIGMLPLTLFFYFGCFTQNEEIKILAEFHDDDEKINETSEGDLSCCSVKGIERHWQLIMLCGITFISSMAEGSINDWGTIFLVDNQKTSPLVAAIGFAAFELFLAGGRLCTDHIVTIYSSTTILQCASILSSFGMALFSLSQLLPSSVSLYVSIAGLAIAGAGMSVCSPVSMSLASRLPRYNPSDAIAMLTTCLYLALLIGPPLIGGLSALLGGLQWALFIEAVLLFCMLFLSWNVSNTSKQLSSKIHHSTNNTEESLSSTIVYSPLLEHTDA